MAFLDKQKLIAKRFLTKESLETMIMVIDNTQKEVMTIDPTVSDDSKYEPLLSNSKLLQFIQDQSATLKYLYYKQMMFKKTKTRDILISIETLVSALDETRSKIYSFMKTIGDLHTDSQDKIKNLLNIANMINSIYKEESNLSIDLDVDDDGNINMMTELKERNIMKQYLDIETDISRIDNKKFILELTSRLDTISEDLVMIRAMLDIHEAEINLIFEQNEGRSSSLNFYN